MDPVVISGVLGVATLIVLAWALVKIVALSKLVQQLAEKIPGTAMSAKELADELGGSIDKAFQRYVPKPDQLAATLTGAIEASAKKQLESAEQLNKTLGETAKSMTAGAAATADKFQSALGGTAEKFQSALGGTADKLQSALGGTADKLETALGGTADKFQSALGGTADKFQSALGGTADRLEAAFGGAADAFQAALGGATGKLESALGGHATEVQNALQGAGAMWKDQLGGALAEHAAKVAEANQTLAAQLDQIASLEKDIVKILHVQETVEGTVREIAASAEFKSTLSELRTHLQESDKLLREVAKPRTIRLVESDGEIAQA